MMHKKFILSIVLCGLFASLQSLYAQVLPDAPKTTTTQTADTFHLVEILPGAKKLQIKKSMIPPSCKYSRAMCD